MKTGFQMPAALFCRFLRNNSAIELFDCTGKRVSAGKIDRSDIYVVKDKQTNAAQKVFVIK
jgi:hypothetical protein